MPQTTNNTKQTLFDNGVTLVTEFCNANDLPLPSITSVPINSHLYRTRACGWYRRNGICIKVPACAAIGRGGPAWSYPGYVIDRTPYGVLAHELGHYVDHTLTTRLGLRSRWGCWGFGTTMRQQSNNAPKLTNYCPNDSEWFAEMFRLFCTNPNLLKAARPAAYEALCQHLTPVVRSTWQTVLANAPARTRQQAAKKIAAATPA